ncbi:MAG TPA: selenide, water dikinase SelD [Stellaceae bacterium]|nr:selenide, water dikinase SelD [Stellaceae bacterium]
MQQTLPIAQDLVLAGGGHAHVRVLKAFAMRPLPGVRLTLVSRDVETPYSGMLPGYVAGRYPLSDCHIDLRRLARFANARFIHDEASGIERGERRLLLAAHPPIRYDFLSLDIGSAPRLDEVPGAAEHTVPVKPIDRFARRWEGLLLRARDLPRLSLAIVGGGAGGVELALSAQHRLAQLFGERKSALNVTLVTREALLPSHNARVRRIFERIFAQRGIAVASHCEIVSVEPHRLHCADGRQIAFDEALWVTQAGAASWLPATGLVLDEGGFVVVDECLRALGQERIFAAGDVAAMRGHAREKAGVYAVRQGPPLAANLRRALASQPLRRAVPQRRALALIGTGDGQAVASRGVLAAHGRLLWRLKDRIDRRWIARYRELPAMAGESADTMRCNGCAAKVPAQILGRVIERLQPVAGGTVALGLESPDDAALLAFPGAPLLLQTVDFFRAMVDDPYLFGRIAATHALGDIYAMDGLPETALAIATVPPGRGPIVEHDLYQMLKGALDVLEPAGAALVGGHSAEGAELGLGFAVTGRPRRTRLLRKGGLARGDRLILTKPLGTGIILAADGRGEAPGRIVEAAIATMLQCSAAAAECLARHGASAATDVTGFGLLGHLLEMLRASAVDASLDPSAIPALDGVLPLIARGIRSSLHAENAAALGALDAGDGLPPEIEALIADPQTSGGLLAGVPAAQAVECLAELRELGYRAALIGAVTQAAGASPRVRLAPDLPEREPAPVS